MNLSYRQMNPDDLSAVFSVRLSTVENAVTMEQLERDYDTTPDSVAEAMKSHVKGWLCEDSESVVGFSMGDRSNGEVLVVAVLPDYEGNGIGRTLIELVQDWLFLEGYKEIWLLTTPDPDTRAYRYYRKLGWGATGRMVDDDEIMVLPKPQDYLAPG